jgi:undecaprenol kinase
MNTAAERVVDLITKEYHPLAKQAKDLAAGAVFIYAVITVVIGIIIFIPYFFRWLF